MPHWLVIDLEATTDEGGWPVTEMEIIEIGATLVDRAGRESQFVHGQAPERKPHLGVAHRPRPRRRRDSGVGRSAAKALSLGRRCPSQAYWLMSRLR